MAYTNDPYNSAIIKQISSMMPAMSASQKRIAFYVIDNIFEVASGSIEDLSEAVGVSTASASRFATTLGFTNYSLFRQALLQAFAPPFVDAKSAQDSYSSDIVQSAFDRAANVLQFTKDHISKNVIDKVVAMITQAEGTYCLAFGQTTPLVNIASICFSPYCKHFHSLSNYGGEVALSMLAKLTKNDLVIIFSFPRYSANAVRMAQFAKDRDAKLLIVTDQPSSPLAPLGDLTLYTSSEHPAVSVSLLGSVAIIETITAALAIYCPEKLKLLENLSGELLPFFFFDNKHRHNKTDRSHDDK